MGNVTEELPFIYFFSPALDQVYAFTIANDRRGNARVKVKKSPGQKKQKHVRKHEPKLIQPLLDSTLVTYHE